MSAFLDSVVGYAFGLLVIHGETLFWTVMGLGVLAVLLIVAVVAAGAVRWWRRTSARRVESAETVDLTRDRAELEAATA